MFEWFGSDLWEEWRATLTAAGTLIALGIAGRTYMLNSRQKREEQARLVYSQGAAISTVPAGSTPEFPDEPDALIATEGTGWGPGRPVKQKAIMVVVEVHNRSKEVIGPLHITVDYTSQPWPEAPGISLQALPPESSVRVCLLGRNEAPVGNFLLEPSILFRDSAGHWWKRRGTEPIHLVRNDPRLASAVDHARPAPDGLRAVSLGTGFRGTYLSSGLLLRFFEISPRIPVLRTMLRKLNIREKAEERALRRLSRAFEAASHEVDSDPARPA
ncbi:hypothetical protein PFZ55_33765 [Streptomyces sp. MS2A]|nr:hypothetical protein [Streptomyces sp. MS2A]